MSRERNKKRLEEVFLVLDGSIAITDPARERVKLCCVDVVSTLHEEEDSSIKLKIDQLTLRMFIY